MSLILLHVAFGRVEGISVDTHVHYIRRKSVPEMIETVRARGYRVGQPS